MKKFIIMLMVLLLVFPFNLVGYAASDTTPPKLLKASINTKDAKVGDTIVLTFELAPDSESGLNVDQQSTSIRLSHTSGETHHSLLTYIGNNKFELRWKLDASTLKGKWIVDYVMFSDNDGNSTTYWDFDTLIKGLTFNLGSIVSEKNPPEMTALTINTSTVKPHQQVKVTLSASDQNQFSGYVNFNHEKTKESISIKINCNQSTKKCEGIYTVPENMKNGEWLVNSVYLKDYFNNEQYFFNEEYSFLNNKKFTVTDGVSDFNKPIFHSVTFSKSSILVGDTFSAYVNAEDPESGIIKAWITLENKVTGHYLSQQMSQNYNDGSFFADFTVPISQMPGQYRIKQISLTDEAGNITFILPDSYKGTLPELTIQSVFSGTDGDVNNILTGTSFDPLLNVKAFSNFEGDLTSEITYSGNVDTQTKGVYLITYNVNSKKQSDYTYKDYRWISVNDDRTVDSEGQETISYFKSNIDVVVPGDTSVSLKNGSKITTLKGKTLLSNEGAYSVTPNQSLSRSAMADPTGQFKFVIDKTLPTTKINPVIINSTSVTGQTEPKAKVTLNLNGKSSYSGKADSKGKFVFKIPKQKVNTKLLIQAKDLAGNISKQQSSKVALPLTIKPVSNRSTIVEGQTVPNVTVNLYINGKYSKQVKANSAGVYKMSISKQAAGKEFKVAIKTKEASAYASTKVADKIAPITPYVNKVTSNSTYVTGRTEKNAKIDVQWIEYTGTIGQGKALSDGTFKIKINQKVKKGSTLKIYAYDSAGNSSYRVIKVN